MMRSLRLWLELREELGDIGFRQGGSLYLAETTRNSRSWNDG